MRKLEQRVTGTEMEWSVLVAGSENEPLAPVSEHLNRLVLRDYLPEGLSTVPSQGMATNGSRIYIDLKTFFEYATPEDTSFSSTVANEIAGERIVQSVFENAKSAGILHDFMIHKRVLSDQGQTWGYHNSYAADGNKLTIGSMGSIKTEEAMLPLMMHQATQNIYTGAGGLWTNLDSDDSHQAVRFALAQKVFNLNCDSNPHSHLEAQPLISLRNESHASGNLIRIHTTSNDANISPWATWMRLGTTSIVIRLMEDGYRGEKARSIKLGNQAAFAYARAVAADPGLKYRAKNDKGEYVRALDIQRELYNAATNLSLPDQEKDIMSEWKRALDDLESDPTLLADRADWVIKRKLFNRVMKENDVRIGSPEVRKVDRAYDLLDPKRSLGMRIRARGVLRQWMPDSADVESAIFNAPQTTRAGVRAEYIKNNLADVASATWMRVDLKQLKGNLELKDPYQTAA